MPPTAWGDQRRKRRGALCLRGLVVLWRLFASVGLCAWSTRARPKSLTPPGAQLAQAIADRVDRASRTMIHSCDGSLVGERQSRMPRKPMALIRAVVTRHPHTDPSACGAGSPVRLSLSS